MVGIVIVSHSAKVAEGICEMAAQMARAEQKILAAGGTADGGIGTDATMVAERIAQADVGEGVLVLADLGSAVLSAETALEFLEFECLAFLCGCLVRALIKTAEYGTVDGWE